MKILISDKVADKAIGILEKEGFTVDIKTGLSEEELIRIIPDYDAMIVRSETKVTSKVIEAGKNLKVIGRAGVGVDNIDLEAATKKGIVVMNTPFGNVTSAAEHTITMMLMLAKHIKHADLSLREGRWDRKKFKGIEVKGKTLGIIGLGKVGQIVAKAANGLSMDVVGFDPFVDEEKAKGFQVKKVEFDKLIKTSDFITVHVPLNNKTRNMISKKEFAMMKDGVRIINVARGGIVNEKDLHDAVESGKVAAAAIDVWEKEPPGKHDFLQHEEILVTPHLGASTIEAQENVAVDIAKQIVDALKNGKIVNAVNKVDKLKD